MDEYPAHLHNHQFCYCDLEISRLLLFWLHIRVGQLIKKGVPVHTLRPKHFLSNPFHQASYATGHVHRAIHVSDEVTEICFYTDSLAVGCYACVVKHLDTSSRV